MGDDEMIKFEMVNDVEQEERRMSNLSDWAPSVSSSTDVQVATYSHIVIYWFRRCSYSLSMLPISAAQQLPCL